MSRSADGSRWGKDVTIDVNVILEGDIVLGDNVEIGPGCVLTDCNLAAGTCLKPYSVLESGPHHRRLRYRARSPGFVRALNWPRE